MMMDALERFSKKLETLIKYQSAAYANTEGYMESLVKGAMRDVILDLKEALDEALAEEQE